VTERSGRLSLLKILPGATPDDAARLRAQATIVSRLRDRGYPAPPIFAVGHVPGLAFWLQERLPGCPMEDTPAVIPRLLPELLRLNGAQAGLGTGPRTWPDLLTTTLTTGGDGYCLHETLAAWPGTRDLLAAVRRIGEQSGPAIPPGDDFVHYDFTLANVLTDGTAVTAVIDVNPPLLAGDRAFDLATLLYYLYDRDDLRAVLRARLLAAAGPRATAAYLAHMVLRQVEWSLRHHPDAPATRRHLDLGRAVIADISPAGEYRGPAR
jgi:Ser/Thr protein kinase RdoA (MazF antagonist)